MHSLSQEFKMATYLLHAHLCTSPHADVTSFNQIWISVKLIYHLLFIMDQILKYRTFKSGLRGAQLWPLRPLRSAPRPRTRPSN